MNIFTKAYLECALWSSTDDDIPLNEDFDITDIDAETLAVMVEDCRRFQAENGVDCALTGHDS